MNTELETPNYEQASQWFGKLASTMLIANGMIHFDYTQVGFVADKKLGVNFPMSIKKLTNGIANLTPFQMEIIARVSLYLTDGGEEYADMVKFSVGLMGKIPQDPNAEVTPARLREIRKTLGLTQTEFGQYLGSALRTVQDWELGNRKIPNTVVEILKAKGQI